MKFINEHLGWCMYGTGMIAVSVGAAIGSQSVVPMFIFGGIGLIVAGLVVGMNRHNPRW